MHDESDQISDPYRRHFLKVATTVAGVVGIAGVAWPFISSMEPSRRALARGQPVRVDISKIEPGSMITVRWRQKPVWILHRTSGQLRTLGKLNSQVKDPESKQPQQLPRYANEYRSLEKQWLVLVGICTHLGCIPDYRPRPGSAGLGPYWLGGFYCPCHGSRYDLAGRVIDGSPAPLNLPVPPYYFEDSRTLSIGDLRDGSEKNWKPAVW